MLIFKTSYGPITCRLLFTCVCGYCGNPFLGVIIATINALLPNTRESFDVCLYLQIVIVYSECIDEEDIERLKFLLSEMEAELVMRSWDLSITASIGSAEIQDHFTKGEEGTSDGVSRTCRCIIGIEGKKPHLLLSSGLEGRKFLNATYFKVHCACMMSRLSKHRVCVHEY